MNSNNILELVRSLDQQKEKINQIRPLVPELELRIKEKIRLELNYHSNALEGNSLTLGETRTLLLEGLTSGGKPVRDAMDIKGHDELLRYAEKFVREKRKLTEAEIREMHSILLKEPYTAEALDTNGSVTNITIYPGQYKTHQNASGGDRRHIFVPPSDVGAKMHELILWLENESPQIHPVILGATFHHRLLAIHPFGDGNGRIARILLNMILLQGGFPPAIIKTNQKNEYIGALRMADSNEYEPLINFIARNVLGTMEIYLKGKEGLDFEELNDFEKRFALIKMQISKKEEVMTATRMGFDKCLKIMILPIVGRLDEKLAFVDEMFESFQFVIEAEGSDAKWNKTFSSRGRLMVVLTEFFQAKKWPKRISIEMQWFNCIKHKSLFNISQKLDFKFYDRYMELIVPKPPKGTDVYNLSYPIGLGDDEISSVVSVYGDRIVNVFEEEFRTDLSPGETFGPAAEQP